MALPNAPKGFEQNNNAKIAGPKDTTKDSLTSSTSVSSAPKSALARRLQAQLDASRAVAKSAAESTKKDSLGFDFGGGKSLIDDLEATDEAEAAKRTAEDAARQRAAAAERIAAQNNAARAKEPTHEEILAKRAAQRPPEQRFQSVANDLAKGAKVIEYGENDEGKEKTGKIDLDSARIQLLMNWPELREEVGAKGEAITGVKVEGEQIVIDYKHAESGQKLKLYVHPDGEITG